MTAQDLAIPAPALWSQAPDDALAALIRLLNARHRGKARGASADELARALCVTQRMLRALVTRARETGVPVSATPETGYYVAQTAEEIEESCAYLHSRALNSLRIEALLRRIPLPDDSGQLEIPTGTQATDESEGGMHD